MRRLRSLLLAGTCAVIVAACGHAAAASAALKVTDLAKLGECPFRVDTVLGTQVRVYRDLAYSTRDDLPTEGKGYVSKARWGGRHRSATSFDVYVADEPFASAEMRAKTLLSVIARPRPGVRNQRMTGLSCHWRENHAKTAEKTLYNRLFRNTSCMLRYLFSGE